ncbi:uncharacterized protein ACIBXB_006106 [Morphnus guianensis]
MGDRSITSRVAYWAGGVDPRERGEPITIRVKGLSELTEGVQKAACVQAMYDRGQQGIPMTAPGAIDRNRQNPQGPAAHVLTWEEVLHSIVVYGREMGWTEPSGGTEGSRKVRPASCKPRPLERSRSRGRADRNYDPERNDLWQKALALGAPRAMLDGQSTDDIRRLVELLEGKAREQREAPATPPPREEKRDPFAALREELDRQKN